MMWSSFHFLVDDILLFESWKIGTTWEMLASCIGIYLLGILLEAMKLVQKKIALSFSKCSLTTDITKSNSIYKNSIGRQMLQVGLFAVQLIINYLLMLIVMSYSVWFGIAVVLGITTGFYIFST